MSDYDYHTGFDTPDSHLHTNDQSTATHNLASNALEEVTTGTASTLHTSLIPEDDSGYASRINAPCPPPPSRKRSRALDDNTSRKRTRRLDPTNPTTPRLACPFYKRDPRRCRYDSCAGPGFEGIHRLKQHLERVHVYQHCTRCGAVFHSASELDAHRGLFAPCALRDHLPPVWGVSEDMLRELKSKRGLAGETEQERWRSVYRLVVGDGEPGDACKRDNARWMVVGLLMRCYRCRGELV